jgi:hypothetical protein
VHYIVDLKAGKAKNHETLQDTHIQTPFGVGLNTLILIVKNLVRHALLDLHRIQRKLNLLIGICQLNQVLAIEEAAIAVLGDRIVIS